MTTAPANGLSAALAGRYTLDRELGGGGMSRVFLAREVALGRTVVLKVLPDEMASGVGAERFAREIQLAASLSQANIVPLLASGDAGGVPFYTMPFVAGDSLRHRLAAGPVPASEALGILRDVARALAYAHERGVVHRDIKPENVLLSHGAAVVTDFGIAKAIAAAREASREAVRVGTLTQAGSSIGTPAYMAPEQAVGDEVDARADLYAWGVVAYELLAGRHPFGDRTTAQQLIAAHVSEPPPSLIDALPIEARHDPQVRAVAAATMRCLSKAPGDRFNSASDLLAALEAHPAAAGRGRVLVAVAAVAVLAVIVAAVALMRRPAAGVAEATGLNPNRVVIATLGNRTGAPSLDPVGVMAADWIARGLASSNVVEVAGTAADLASRGVATALPGIDPRKALANITKAGLVVAGTYYAQGDSLLLQADIFDLTKSDSPLLSIEHVGALASAPLAGVEELRKRVVGGLAVLRDSTLNQWAARSMTMPAYEAYREFLQGEQLYYRDPKTSRAHYERAAAADSTYNWPILRLITNAFDVGDGGRMDSLITVLKARRSRLSEYEAGYLDLMACSEVPGQGEQCLSALDAMQRASPKSQFAAYMRALVVRQLNRPVRAESIFKTLDRHGGELRGRTNFYQHYASAELQLGHDSSALTLAREGNAVAGRRIYLYFEMAALAHMRRFDEMRRAFDTVWALPPERRAGAAARASLVLYVLRHQGDSAQADTLGTQLLAALARRSAPEADSPNGRTERASVLMAMRRWAELDTLTALMTRTGDDRRPTLEARGVALAALGRRAEAMEMLKRLEHPTRPVGPEDICVLTWQFCRAASRAKILAMLGQRAEATALLDDRMYRIFVNWYADWDLLGEALRGDPAFEEFIRLRG